MYFVCVFFKYHESYTINFYFNKSTIFMVNTIYFFCKEMYSSSNNYELFYTSYSIINETRFILCLLKPFVWFWQKLQGVWALNTCILISTMMTAMMLQWYSSTRTRRALNPHCSQLEQLTSATIPGKPNL